MRYIRPSKGLLWSIADPFGEGGALFWLLLPNIPQGSKVVGAGGAGANLLTDGTALIAVAVTGWGEAILLFAAGISWTFVLQGRAIAEAITKIVSKITFIFEKKMGIIKMNE